MTKHLPAGTETQIDVSKILVILKDPYGQNEINRLAFKNLSIDFKSLEEQLYPSIIELCKSSEVSVHHAYGYKDT